MISYSLGIVTCAGNLEGHADAEEVADPQQPHVFGKRMRGASSSHPVPSDMHDMLSKIAEVPEWPQAFGVTDALIDTMPMCCGVRETVLLRDGVAHAFKDCISRYRGYASPQAILKVLLTALQRFESVRSPCMMMLCAFGVSTHVDGGCLLEGV